MNLLGLLLWGAQMSSGLSGTDNGVALVSCHVGGAGREPWDAPGKPATAPATILGGGPAVPQGDECQAVPAGHAESSVGHSSVCTSGQCAEVQCSAFAFMVCNVKVPTDMEVP